MLSTNNLLFWAMAFFFMGNAIAQNFFDSYQQLNKEKPTYHSEVDSLIENAIEQNAHFDAIKITGGFAVYHYRKRNYQEAICYGKWRTEIYESLNLITEDYAAALYSLGRFYAVGNDYNAAIESYKKAIETNFNTEKVALSYCEIGANYAGIGDYFNAVNYYKSGILKLEEIKKVVQTVKKSLDLSNVYEQINSPESLANKRELLEHALLVSETTNLPSRTFFNLHNNIASYYNNPETLNFEKSYRHYQIFLKRAKKIKDSVNIGTCYSNMGNLYHEVENDSAVFYYNKALEYLGDDPSVKRTYNHLAAFYRKKNIPNKSLVFAEKTLAFAFKNELQADLSEKALRQLDDKFSILHAYSLQAHAYIQRYLTDTNKTHLQTALAQLKKANRLIDVLHLESSEEKSKLYWRKEASSIYSKAIYCAAELGENELAFHFSEKSKALVLTESIISNNLKLDLPKPLLEKELTFKKRILELENTIQSSTESKELEKELLQTKLANQKFTDSLKEQFPDYYHQQETTQLSTLAQVQNLLTPNQVVLSYNWDLNDPFFSQPMGIYISKETIDVFSVENKNSIKPLISSYRKALQKPFETKLDKDNFTKAASGLFHVLFPSKFVKNVLPNKHLIIVPDGLLQGIPFEALVDNNSGKYLLETNEISYTYSISFSAHNKSIERRPTEKFTGFAPVYFKDTSLDSLPKTIDELKSIAALFSGNMYTFKEATKSNFTTYSTDSQIIHLATHADASGNPWIAFQDERLELHDLYTLKNQADLVVLSACKTNLGTVASGEGVLSLARGFFYSGANAVVSSLWNANSKASSQLLTQFYKNIDEGQSKSKALQNSKLDYLQSNSLSDASPYYWACFIVIGDTQPIAQETSYFYAYLALGILFLLMMVFFIKKRI